MSGRILIRMVEGWRRREGTQMDENKVFMNMPQGSLLLYMLIIIKRKIMNYHNKM